MAAGRWREGRAWRRWRSKGMAAFVWWMHRDGRAPQCLMRDNVREGTTMITYKQVKDEFERMKPHLGNWSMMPEAVALDKLLKKIDKAHENEEISTEVQVALLVLCMGLIHWIGEGTKQYGCTG
jgi:hypothetical protein